jgi:hypothetical protein
LLDNLQPQADNLKRPMRPSLGETPSVPKKSPQALEIPAGFPHSRGTAAAYP